jgi:hypothetical protein
MAHHQHLLQKKLLNQQEIAKFPYSSLFVILNFNTKKGSYPLFSRMHDHETEQTK